MNCLLVYLIFYAAARSPVDPIGRTFRVSASQHSSASNSTPALYIETLVARNMPVSTTSSVSTGLEERYIYFHLFSTSRFYCAANSNDNSRKPSLFICIDTSVISVIFQPQRPLYEFTPPFCVFRWLINPRIHLLSKNWNLPHIPIRQF